MTPGNIADFLKYAHIEDWRPGEVIKVYSEGTGFYYVISGEVSVVRLYEKGHKAILQPIRKDEFFFDAAYFRDEKRTLAAWALSRVKSAYFESSTINELLSTSLAFCHIVIHSLGKKSFDPGKSVPNSLCSDSETHMLNILYGLSCMETGKPRDVVAITQTVLAGYVGKHLVNTNITLKRLEEKNLIRVGRSRIYLNLDMIVPLLVGSNR